MSSARFLLFTLGPSADKYETEVKPAFDRRFSALDLDPSSDLVVLSAGDETEVDSENAGAVGLWFGDGSAFADEPAHLATLKALLTREVPVFPLISDASLDPPPLPAEFQGRRVRAWSDDRAADDLLRGLGLVDHYVYQLVLFGPDVARYSELRDPIERDMRELGLDPPTDLVVLDAGQMSKIDFKGAILAVWFGGPPPFTDEAAQLKDLQSLIERSVPVLPLVDRVGNVDPHLPEALRKLNAAEWEVVVDEKSGVHEPNARLSADVLKLLGLTRDQRQAFVSYRRSESVGVARQLFHTLSDRGYRVFLDTTSVERAVPFQAVLHDRLADTDLIILLDSPTVLSSEWVREELTLVHQLGLGVLQLSWPAIDKSGHAIPDPNDPTKAKPQSTKGTEFSVRLELQPEDFVSPTTLIGTGAKLRDEILRLVADRAEQARVRSLAARRERVVSYLKTEAERANLRVVAQPGRPIELRRDDPKDEVVAIAYAIPGLPDAWEVFRLEKKIAGTNYGAWNASHYEKHRIVFDGMGILGDRRDHLEYLNNRLHLQTLMMQGLFGWLGVPAAAGTGGGPSVPAGTGGGPFLTANDIAAQARIPTQGAEDESGGAK